jgi:glycosyltransferase involved in cell wall biosynthesis
LRSRTRSAERRGAGSTSACRRYRDAIPTAAIVSFRLGGPDGVAVEAAKWQRALGTLGFTAVTVAGDGPVDRTLPGLAIGAGEAPERGEVAAALDDADLVVVENLCSLPLNPGAAAQVAAVLAGRPALFRHHDLPWQREQFADHGPPPDDPCWRHVTINELSRRELGARGVSATTVYNSFEVDPGLDVGGANAGRRGAKGDAVRAALGVAETTRLVLQPTRAIPRKNVAGGIAAATELGGTYWLLGPAEDGFGATLEGLVANATCPILLGPPDGRLEIRDAYEACDVVVLPSTWEGFGNPSVESAARGRPLAVGPYPVAKELTSFGFRWFELGEMARLSAWLEGPRADLLEHNLGVAAARFSTADLPDRLAAVLPEL